MNGEQRKGLVRFLPNGSVDNAFAAVNFILGTTRAPLVAYLLATLVGMAPRTAAAVWAAAHASKLDFHDSTQIWIFVGGLIVTLAVIGVIGEIANKAVKRVTTAQPQPQ